MKALLSIAGAIVSVLVLYSLLMSENISLGGVAVLFVLVIYVPYLIIVGKKRTERALGYVAETCPQCATARTVNLSRVGMAQSLFTFPVGQGELEGFSAKCETCACVFEVQATDYLAFEPNASAFAPVGTTNPKLDPENRIALAAFERLALIRAQFLKASQVMAGRYERGQSERMDVTTLISLVATCGVPIWLGFTYSDTPLWIDVALFGLGIVVTGVLMYKEPGRYFNNVLQPALAKALAPLQPQPAELEACVLSLNLYGDRIAKYLVTRDLQDEVSKAPSVQDETPSLPELATGQVEQQELLGITVIPVASPVVDKNARGLCPNCDSDIALDSPQCPNPGCNALFGPHSSWKIRPV